jgi:branched-chain amino acid transport system ATP-binding protein
LLNTISGAYVPETGSIRLGGIELVGQKVHRIAAAGIARTFQNIRLFGTLTVLANVLVSRARLQEDRWYDVLAGSARHRRSEASSEALAHAALARVGLAERANERAAALPYAQQRLLEIARALAAEPKLLILDEPAAGMTMTEAMRLMDLVRGIAADGVTVLLVEHNMRLVMGVSERISVLDFGSKIAEGAPAEIAGHPAVIEAYLGRPRAKGGAGA